MAPTVIGAAGRADRHRAGCGSRETERHVLVDEAFDRRACRDAGAGAGHEEAGGKENERRNRDRADAAGDALVVEPSGQPDLAAVDGDIEDACAEVAGLAPHALVADIGELTHGRASDRDDGHALDDDRLGDFHVEALADAELLALGRQLLRKAQRDRRSGPQDCIRRCWRGDRRAGAGAKVT